MEYEDLTLEEQSLSTDGVLRAWITLHNAGSRPALETAQAYVSDRVTSVSWADQELKAYRQVDLAPGETERVSIEIPVRELAIVDAAGRRVVEPGEFELRVGRSSRSRDQLRTSFWVG